MLNYVSAFKHIDALNKSYIKRESLHSEKKSCTKAYSWLRPPSFIILLFKKSITSIVFERSNRMMCPLI